MHSCVQLLRVQAPSSGHHGWKAVSCLPRKGGIGEAALKHKVPHHRRADAMVPQACECQGQNLGVLCFEVCTALAQGMGLSCRGAVSLHAR